MSKHTDKYWRKRLITRPGVSGLHCRIQYDGHSHYFNLHTDDKDEAASKAKDIWLSLQTVGLTETLAKYKPKSLPKAEKVLTTVGEWINAIRPLLLARDKKPVRPHSFTVYASVLRRAAANISGVGDAPRRIGPLHDAWLKSANAVLLADMKPEKIKAWMMGKADAVSNNPAALSSCRRTLRSYSTFLKVVFHKNLIAQLPNVKLPTPLPCEGLPKFDPDETTYVSKVNAKLLLVSAISDLKPNKPEEYKSFLLAVCCGLRRHEIDLLEWDMIDFERGVVRVHTTDLLLLKSKRATRPIPIEPSIKEELRSFKAQSKSKFVISSEGTFTPGAERMEYRCEKVLNSLVDWLRSKGVTAKKPIHELRKEYGTMIVNKHGIFAACRLLGHSDIRLTESTYADLTEEFTVGLGDVLNPHGIVHSVTEPKETTQEGAVQSR